MVDFLALSASFIDESCVTEARSTLDVNSVTGKLSEVTDNMAFIEGACHVPVFNTSDGLVIVDISTEAMAPKALASLRNWTDEPIRSVILARGHVGGVAAFVDVARG